MATALLAGGCGGGSDDVGSGGGPPPKGTVIIRDISFKPDRIRVKPGETVTWRFEDEGIPHDVAAEDESYKSETMDSGTFTHTFDAPGTYKYLCTLHPSQMKGVIEVR
ncbi:MAG: plastocyanin/azurin family copper-binding protein [Acidimicrobiales bacterium]